MKAKEKLSPAFEPFLAGSGPNDRRDAIVIYRAETTSCPPHSRLCKLKERLDYVNTRAAEQKPVQERLLETYKKSSSRYFKGDGEAAVAAVGSGALPVASVEVTRRSLSTLLEQPEVVAVLPNQKIELIQPHEIDYADLKKSEMEDGLTWGLKQLGIPTLWEKTRGDEINVAVLDTGVHGDHPALKDRVKDFLVIDPLGRRITASPTFDANKHGTHVCGTIAGGKTAQGVSIGVAPNANLLAGGVLVGDATLRTLVEGLSWAIEKGAHIINMSLGFDYYEPLFANIFDLLIEQFGILPVVAIGNSNHGSCSSPGNSRSAFAVGAVEKMPGNKVEVVFFSSGASLVFPGEAEPLVTKPDVAAPGVQVFSCIPPEKRADGTYEYTYMSGTSMACPHAAGAAALLMAAKPQAPVQKIISALKETAEHPEGSSKRPDNRWGYGMIRPAAALEALDALPG